MQDYLNSLLITAYSVKQNMRENHKHPVLDAVFNHTKSIGQAVSEWGWTSVMQNKFYYEDFKGDKKEVFERYLGKYGLKDSEEKSQQLLSLDGKEAFKKVSEWTNPNIAVLLRENEFLKPGALEWHKRVAAVFPPSPPPLAKGVLNLEEDAIAKQWERRNKRIAKGETAFTDYHNFIMSHKKFVDIDYDDMGMENAFYMGLVKSLPVARSLVQFTGTGMDKLGENTGMRIMQGYGALVGTLSQFALLGKAMNPFVGTLFGKLGFGIQKSFLGGKTIATIFDTGAKTAQILVPSLSGALDFGILTSIQTALWNAAQGRTLDDSQVAKIINDVELGGALGCICGAWSGSTVPWVFKKPTGMMETTSLFALENMKNKYQDTGAIDITDFKYGFLHMSTQVPMMQLIPILMGLAMGTPFDILSGDIGSKQTLAKIGLELQTRLLKSERPSLSTKGIKTGVIVNLKKKAPTDIMGLRVWVDNLKGEAAKRGVLRAPKNMAESVVVNGEVINAPTGVHTRKLMSSKDVRRFLYSFERTLVEHGVKPKATKTNILKWQRWAAKDMTNMTKGYLTEKDAEANMNRMLHILQTAQAEGTKFASPKEIIGLRNDLLKNGVISSNYAKRNKIKIQTYNPKEWAKQRAATLLNIKKVKGQLALPAPKGKNLIRVVDGNGKEIGKVKGDIFLNNYIRDWTEEELGTKVPIEKLYNFEIAAIRDNIALRTVGRDVYLALEEDVSPIGAASMVTDAIKGYPFYMADRGLVDNYFEVRGAQTGEYSKWSKLIYEDARNIFMKIGSGKMLTGEGWKLLHNEKFAKILRYSQLKGRNAKTARRVLHWGGINIKDTKGFDNAYNEYHAWKTSDRNSSFYKKNNWNLNIKDATGQPIKGLRDFFDISYDIGIKKYEPLILYTADDKVFYEKGDGSFENVHNLVRKADVSKIRIKDWMASDASGWDGLTTYYNRNLLDKYMSGPLNRLSRAVVAKKLTPSDNMIISRWIAGIKGKPNRLDMTVNNWVGETLERIPMFIRTKLPGVGRDGKVTSQQINNWTAAALSFIYAGGLGLKFSSAMKNATQGPLNNPPGMSIGWWFTGLRDIMMSREKRNMLWENGIFRGLGVPGLYRGMGGKTGALMQGSLFLFTAVDHYWNRGPIYLGARNQVDDYIKRFGIMEGITRIARKQRMGIRDRMIRNAELARNALLLSKGGTEAIRRQRLNEYGRRVERIKDEYGFIQQANSNWQYGKLGRPSVFGTHTGKFLATFMTWPAWYWGTYVPSLVAHDWRGLIEHGAKQMLVFSLFSKYLDINLKPWVGLGTLPTAPYGPTMQAFFDSIRLLQAHEYNNPEWEAEIKQDLLMDLKVGIPLYYGVTDMYKLMEELRQETPYFDKRTGILHRDNNGWKAWSDFFGVPMYHTKQSRYLEAIKNSAYKEVAKYEERYNMEKLNRTPRGIRIR